MADDFGFLEENDDPLRKYKNSEVKEPEASATVVIPPRTVAVQPVSLSLAKAREVTDAPIVGALFANSFDAIDENMANNFKTMLGYVPLDLTNPTVKAMLIRARPEFASAYEQPAIRGFMKGISVSSLKLCNGLMLCAISRALLDEVISQMTLQAKGRKRLLPFVQEIQGRIIDVVRKSQRFEDVMAETIRDFGTVSTLLRYGADVDKLVEKLRAASERIDDNSQQLQEEEKNVTEKMQSFAVVVTDLLQNDGQYQNLSNKMNLAVEKRQRQDVVLQGHYDEYWNTRKDLAKRKARNLIAVQNINRMKQMVNTQIAEKNARVQHIDGMITQYDQLKKDYEDDHRDEQNRVRDFLDEMQSCIKDTVNARKEQQKQEIELLTQRRKKLLDAAERYRDQSQYASDGVEFRQETHTNRGFWGLWSSSSTSTTRIDRPNEKLRLQEMAETVRNEAADIEARLGQLRNAGSAELINDIKGVMGDDLRDLRIAQAEAASAQRRDNNVRAVDTQIRGFRNLKEDIERKRNQLMGQLNEFNQRLKDAKGELKEIEEAENEVDNPSSRIQLQIEAATNARQEALNDETKIKDELKLFVETFGELSDYGAFFRTFGLLNKSIKNLPSAMLELSNCFKGAEKTYVGEIFREDLESLPKEGRKMMLQDVSIDLQNVCMIAWDMFSVPFQRMVNGDIREVLDPIVAQQKMDLIRESTAKAVEAPKEEQEDDQPRRVQEA